MNGGKRNFREIGSFEKCGFPVPSFPVFRNSSEHLWAQRTETIHNEQLTFM